MNLSTRLKKMLEEEIEVKVDESGRKEKKRMGDIVIRKLIKKAMDGETRAIREILDRVDGKTKQQIDVTTAGEPIGKDEVNYNKLSDAALREIVAAGAKGVDPPKDPQP